MLEDCTGFMKLKQEAGMMKPEAEGLLHTVAAPKISQGPVSRTLWPRRGLGSGVQSFEQPSGGQPACRI